MRSTCPTNDVAEAMSAATNRDIYRLFISHKDSSGLPAYHNSFTNALFGFTKIVPDERDRKFQNHAIEMVKKFAYYHELEDCWSTFPVNR